MDNPTAGVIVYWLASALICVGGITDLWGPWDSPMSSAMFAAFVVLYVLGVATLLGNA